MSSAINLIIGVGGLGSSVVNEVYGKIPKEYKDQTRVQVFDTNVGDIDELTHLNQEHISKTSIDGNIGSYRKAHPEVNDWLPDNIEDNQTIIDGAGQIRSVSRLGFYAYLKQNNNAFSNLDRQLNLLHQINTNDKISIRIIVVSSLVGGTGSGLILPLGMYIRNRLRTKYNNVSAKIRGLFILPQALIDNNFVSAAEVDRITANGYASMKELKGIIQYCDQMKSDNSVRTNIQLDYGLNQNSVINHLDEPYDLIQFFHSIRDDGKKFDSFDDIRNQIVRVLECMVSFPMYNGVAGTEDNTYATRMASHRNGSCGMASLIYPKNDLIDYLSAKWQHEVIKIKWCEIDNDYDAKDKKFKNKNSRNEFFIGQMEAKKGDDFYKEKYNSMFSLNADFDPDYDKPLYKDYLLEITKEIKSRLNSAALVELSKAISKPIFQGDKVTDDPNIANNILQREGVIKKYRKEVEKIIDNDFSVIANNLVGQIGDSFEKNKLHIIRKLNNEKPLDPFASRFFIIELRRHVENNLLAIKSGTVTKKSLLSLERYIDGYINKDWNKATAEKDEPQEYFNALLKNQGIIDYFKKLINQSEAEDFLEYYNSNSKKVLSVINEYFQTKLTQRVYESFKEGLENYLKKYDQFYKDLAGINFSKIVSEIEKKYTPSDHDDKTIVNLLEVTNGGNDFEKVWVDSVKDLVSVEINQELSKEITTTLFKLSHESTKMVDSRGILEDWVKSEINNLPIIQYNFNEFYSYLETNLKKASIVDRVSELNALASYNLPIGDAKPNTWLGISLPPSLTKNDQLTSKIKKTIDSINIEEAINEENIHLYKSFCGKEISDVAGFGESEMLFQKYRSYLAEVNKNKLQDEWGRRIVTPHMDKNWHHIAYFPDLNGNIAVLEQEKIKSAFMVCFLTERMKFTDELGSKKWVFTDSIGNSEVISYKGKTLDESGSILKLMDALQYLPTIVDKAPPLFEKIINADQKEFFSGAAQIEDMLLSKKLGSINLDNCLIAGLVVGKDNSKVNVFDLIKYLENNQEDSLFDTLVSLYGNYFSKAKYNKNSSLDLPPDHKKELWQLLDDVLEKSLLGANDKESYKLKLSASLGMDS